MNMSLENIPMPKEPASNQSVGERSVGNDGTKNSPYVSDSVAWLRARQALLQLSTKSESSSTETKPQISYSSMPSPYFAVNPTMYQAQYMHYHPPRMYGSNFQQSTVGQCAPSGQSRLGQPVNHQPMPSPYGSPISMTPLPPSARFRQSVLNRSTKPANSQPTPYTSSPVSKPSNIWKPSRPTAPLCMAKPKESPEEKPLPKQSLATDIFNSALSKPLNAGTMPEGAKHYVFRAMESAKTPEDEQKIEKMLRMKLMPLLESGLAWKMNWAEEPLPTDPKFVLPSSDAWTPAAALKKLTSISAFGKMGAGRNVFRDNDNDDRYERYPENRSRSASKRFRRDFDTSPIEQGSKPKRARRSGRKTKRQLAESFEIFNEIVDEDARKRRALRFAECHSAKSPSPEKFAFFFDKYGSVVDDSQQYDPLEPIVGTCQDVNKKYLRLTSFPEPSQVRPEYILKEAFALVKENWDQTTDYSLACDQLKSIRQDLMIQCIRNSFAIDVYEFHARIALEHADKEEFNQCQNQLKSLYTTFSECPNEPEFLAYRLLFYVFTENVSDIGLTMGKLTPRQRNNSFVQFACHFCEAWALGDFHTLFQLYTQGAPGLCSYLVKLVLDRERKRALKKIIKAHRPTKLPVSYVVDELAFVDANSCNEFLQNLQVPIVHDQIDCRQVTAFG